MKIFIITGASDGIGAEMARQLAAAHGADAGLVLAARNRERLDAVAAQCEALGAKTLVAVTNVSEEPQCRALVDQALKQFGRIDALINNAGVSAQALFADVKAQDLHWYENLMKVNLWGSVWCTHAALPHLVASKGSIVAVFFEALRAELKSSGVSVTTAFPGVVATSIRHHGYNARGEPAGVSGLKEDDAMTVEECARLIVEGMNARRREVVMTPKARLGRFVKLIAPGVVENMALAALKDEAKPKTH
jgi:short-subunit dehydrogenase